MRATRTCCILLLLGFLAHQGKAGGLKDEKNPGKGKRAIHIVIQGFVDPVVRSDTQSCIIPFTRAGKLILLKGKADNTEGSFLLDTGAPELVLNNTYFREKPSHENHEEVQRFITGEGGNTTRTEVVHFTLGSIHYYKVEAELLNLGQLENTRNTRILGLLGVSLFKQCEVIIDYVNNVLHLHHINKKERKTYQHPMLKNKNDYIEQDFLLKDNRIIVDTRIRNRKLQFVVDCAAEANIIDSRLPASIIDSLRVNGRILISGGGQGKVEAVMAAIPELDIGGLHLREIPVIISNLKNTCFGNTSCINGVLGYDFLSRNRLVFNFVKRKLYILK